ncbi:hypothetical protein Harman_14330 [Haloarcula mannanilytica]|uniref:Methyl-accepting chemotaxis protein n=1 Tax=Haloarcula mannanilytica TaxID=2509225 RepID=A0A4C2EG84_9EURY|nr:methyl-accepting chemotaxis protein [Haloarcula mannanilytica]GCF13498.1 hypothetical protein Harman_14330 [Haloarcula mannanilytica]
MDLQIKLIVLLLTISLAPLAGVGLLSANSMGELNQEAQTQSGNYLRGAMTDQLNNSVEARQEGIQNQVNQREVDVRSLADSSTTENYLAAQDGEMELVQESSQRQLGYMSLQMRATIDSAMQTVLENQYDGQDWEDLSATEQEQVKREVESMVGGTAGDQTQPSGTMYDSFQPGYMGDTGYAYITDSDSNIVVHYDLDDGHNLKEDSGGTLVVFDDIKADIESNQAVRNGEDWGIAEYEWEDTTQEGNPEMTKFIAYTYYEPFDWIIAPSVYYHELQQTAVSDAESEMGDSFERYLLTRTVTVGEEEHLAYEEITFAGPNGDEIIHAERSGQDVTTGSDSSQSYADTDWFTGAQSGSQGEAYFGEVQTEDGHEKMYISTPVYRDGEFRGVIAAQFNYSLITDTTNRVTVGESGYLYILNEQGEVVSHPDQTMIEQRTNVAEGEYGTELGTIAQNQMLAGESGMTTHTKQVEGEGNATRYVGFAPLQLGDKQYTLVATVPEQDINEPIAALAATLQSTTDSAQTLVIGLFGLAAIVVSVTGYAAARYISKPIEQVRDRAIALSKGQFDQTDDISTGDDEIGEMVTAFEDMQSNLNRQVEQIESVSNSLSDGHLDDEIETDMPGKFGEIMVGLEDGMSQLSASFTEISQASQNIRAGELDQDLDTDLPGDYGEVMRELNSGLTQLSESFEQLESVSADLREGHLDQDLDTDLPGAYGEVLANIDEGLDAVDESIAKVQSIAQDVSEASTEVAASTTEIEEASQEVAESVQEISSGADTQSDNLQEVASEMNDMSATIEEIASSSVDVANTAQEAAERAQMGSEQAAEASAEIQEIEDGADDAVDQVSDLQTEMEEISEIVAMITDIAEQTNMLALNASIEAARAGEAGEGFAVVADEIKSLASEAGEASEEVESLITEIQNSTDETVDDIEDMRDQVESGVRTTENAIDLFDEIAEVVDDAESGVTEISDATDEQAATTEEVVAMVDEVSSVSEETAAEASNVSAASEEQSSSLTSVSENVQSVAGLADDLEELVDEFEVSDDTDTTELESLDIDGAESAAGDD